MSETPSRNFGISHDIGEESIVEKGRWFQSLTPEERMRMLNEWTELVLQNNPRLIGVKDAIAVEGRIRVLELPAR